LGRALRVIIEKSPQNKYLTRYQEYVIIKVQKGKEENKKCLNLLKIILIGLFIAAIATTKLVGLSL
jgi:hypothetical protein